MNIIRHFVIPSLCALNWIAAAGELSEHAAQMRSELSEKVMPHWYDTTIDNDRGGYLLGEDGRGGARAVEKQLVTQSRMIWGFAHAHLRGLSGAGRDYLEAARHGHRFLTEKFLDREHGGYFWTTDLEGNVRNPRKIIYGNAFVLYALVELYRAGGDPEVLREAMALHNVIQVRAHDGQHRGWIEHFERDWRPILAPSEHAIVEVAGYKSANTHLHLMEAFTELHLESKAEPVQKSLRESLELNAKYFYPPNAGESCFHRKLDWGFVADPSSAGLSYGHNVEFAWLMIRAQEALGDRPDWDHFFSHLNHSLKYGYDHERGGLFNRGTGDEPASQKDKIWWVEAEMLAALTDAVRRENKLEYRKALDQLLHFVWKHQVDPKDGMWFDTVGETGDVKNPRKSHNWKAAYHDVRAIVKFIEAFGEAEKP